MCATCEWASRLRVSLLLVILSFGLSPRASAQVLFSEVGPGMVPSDATPGMVSGAAAADFDNDGLVDFFVPNADGVANHLYHNLGNGQILEIGVSAGVGSTLPARGALWFDYDGDQDLDLLVTREDGASTFTLYRQNAPSAFQDVTAAANLNLSWSHIPDGQPGIMPHRGGVCAGDINNDGYLDFCVTFWRGLTRLFLNNKDGSFTEITASCGFNLGEGHFWQPMMADFNGDGWLDIYVLVDFGGNMLWINQKDNTFVEVAASSGLNNSMNDMGMSLGDYDNDGDLDIYITNIQGYVGGNMVYNVLYRNDSVGSSLSYADVSIASQVHIGGWAWGTTFFDADNDGWLDLAVTNDSTSGASGGGEDITKSRFFLNPGVGPFVFQELSDQVAFNGDFKGGAVVALDFDRDGDLDLLEACIDAPARLMESDPVGGTANNNYLTVLPRMQGPNHRAIGAIVRASAGGLNLMRLISAGNSCLGQEPAEAFFGLGTASLVDTVVVEWPDGTVTTLTDVSPNQELTMTHGGFGDLNADGNIGTDDYGLFEPCMTGPGDGTIIYSPSCRASDMNADGDVDLGDAAILATRF